MVAASAALSAQPAGPPRAEMAPRATAVPQPGPGDAEIANFFHNHVAREVRRLKIPGASLVVVRDGRVILSRGYGYADLTTKRPISPQATLVRQGSTTKLMIWLLAMQLAEEGRLNLDRDVNAYLDFRIPERFGKPITMRHLMTHTAGFADAPLPDRQRSLREELAANLPARVYAPGATVAYSNYGASLAAHIVERLHGRPFDELVRERLLEPLGMKRSSIEEPLPAALRPSLASGYSAGAREPVAFGPTGELLRPAGALAAPAEDMGRLVAMLLAGGKSPGGAIVVPRALEQMLQLHKPLAPGIRSGLGLGFIVGEHRGIRYAGHGGTHSGGASDLELLPDQGLGWNIAFNGRGLNGAAVEARAQLLRAVIDRFFKPAPVQVQPRGPSAAEDAAGQYLSARRPHSGPMRMFEALGAVSASSNGDGTLTTDMEGSKRDWLPDGPDRFRDSKTGIPLAVTRDDEGRVVRLGSVLLNNVAEFERAPLEVRLALPILAFALPVLLLTGLVRLGLRLFRRRSQKREQHQGVGRFMLVLAGSAPWLIVLTFALWPTAAMTGLANGTGVPAALKLLSILAVTSAAALAGKAVMVARSPSAPVPQKVGQGLAGLAAAGAAYLIVAFELTGL